MDELVVPPEKLAEARDIDERVKNEELLDIEVRRPTAEGDRYCNFRNIAVTGANVVDGYAVYADIHERIETTIQDTLVLARQGDTVDELR